jgi:WD40-like Beta Propeller Repeat
MRKSVSIFLAVAVVACTDIASPSHGGGIAIITGGNGRDSAGAELSRALIVEVRDSSGNVPPPGTIVRFAGVPLADGSASSSEILVETVTSNAFQAFATCSTDTRGRAAVLIKLGPKAGVGRLAISAPTLDAQDTARFEVLPGAAVKLKVLPSDTALYVGRSYTLRGGVVDRNGNVRNDPVMWSVSDTGAFVASDGTVTATKFGRYILTGTAGAFAATGSVSVVPQGRLAAWRAGLGVTSYIVSLNLDGSSPRELAPVSDGGIGANPVWVPGTERIVYADLDGATQVLRAIEETGRVRSFFVAVPKTVSHQAEPAPSADGQWLYLAAVDSQCSSASYCLYRSKPDATALEMLATRAGTGVEGRNPAPSPDGSSVAFVSGSTIKVLDVVTRTVDTWSVPGTNPSWSPNGAQIALLTPAGVIRIVNADGTNGPTLKSSASVYNRPVRWTPDGNWIIARATNAGVLQLINAATGDIIPLPYSTQLQTGSVK